VWSYKLTSSSTTSSVLVFRATRYEAGFPGLDGQTLTPTGPIDVALNPAPAGLKPPAF